MRADAEIRLSIGCGHVARAEVVMSQVDRDQTAGGTSGSDSETYAWQMRRDHDEVSGPPQGVSSSTKASGSDGGGTPSRDASTTEDAGLVGEMLRNLGGFLGLVPSRKGENGAMAPPAIGAAPVVASREAAKLSALPERVLPHADYASKAPQRILSKDLRLVTNPGNSSDDDS